MDHSIMRIFIGKKIAKRKRPLGIKTAGYHRAVRKDTDLVTQTVAESVGIRRTFGRGKVGPIKTLTPFEEDMACQTMTAPTAQIAPLIGEGRVQRIEDRRIVGSRAEVP